jgi:hypothetical protein
MAVKTISGMVHRLPFMKRYVPALAFFILVVGLTHAEGTGSAAGPSTQADYYFETDAEGKPSFTQCIRWQGDPNALRYEIVLYDADGNTIDRTTTTNDYVEFHLQPGDYGYSIIVYNLLDQAEFVSDLIEFTVKRAEFPVIAGVKPATIYMDEGKPTLITIEGELIMSGAEVTLVDQAKGKKNRAVVGTIRKNEDAQTAVVEFPREELHYGYYALRIRNPGGLETEAEKRLKVRYQKPLDFFISVEYAPTFPLYDSYYTENWSDSFYPLGAGARIGCYFLKRQNHYFGAEVFGSMKSMEGGISEATIETVQTTVALNAVYAWRLNSAWRLTVRGGGGISHTTLSFDYQDTQGETLETNDPFVSVGLGAQWFLFKHLYAELGASWTNVFRIDYVEGAVSPNFSIGFYY